MASRRPHFDTTEEKTNFTRLVRLVIDGGTRVLRDFLHSLYPSTVLPTVLKKNETIFQNLKSKGRIFVNQWEKLFPPSGSLPDAETFDITLLHLLLREICYLVEPVTGWHNMPADTDSSREAHIVRIKCFRNELCHSISTAISNDEFQTKWTFISRSLVALGLDMKEIDQLKTESIDHDTKRRVEEEMKRWKDLEPRVLSVEEKLQQLQLQLQSIDINVQEPRTPGLCSCLPDRLPEAFGRSQDIQKATEAIHNEAAAAVMITGAPGFGKTTVANKVAYELDRLQHVVFYCSLRSKASLNEVASSMILVCSTNQCQPPENPQHWLLNWSKQQLDLKITFVLDNADDALESQESRSQFVTMVCDMRNLSKQNITFVITSRKTFNSAGYHLAIEEIRLSSLSQDEATKLLLSKIYNVEKRSQLSQTKRMVDLCGCVPLALCIVGSLLSDFEEDLLINSLEKELLDVLQDDEVSLENTIKTSFDHLAPQERKALATFSVFPGSFDFDAAKDVTATINQFAASETMAILRSLKNRSLLEKPSSGKFQVHQLIQAFARKTDETNYHPQVFADVEKVACAHFISRLDDAAQQYWSKDKCRESIEAFNSERYNFEYFLQVYVKTMAEHPYLDPFLESCTKKFLDQFPQKCMYLEMCLLPSFYITVLETLLTHFNKGNQPLHTVELLCLLANELRKIGRRVDYIDLMEQAKCIYHWNYTEFRTNGLSQVFFFNSYARLVFEKRIKTFKKMSNKVYEIALILCDKKLLGHPERAVTKLLIGKHRKSIPLLQEATNLLTQCLGNHYMTAQGHKAIADVYFAHRDTEKELNMSLYHYMLALEMMKKCGMSGQKETTLTLKNYASCQRRKGNYEEAMTYLEKAKRIAEIELEDDHRWKVMIDTQLALLHEDFGFIDEAIDVMKNSLEMCCRLCLSVDHLGNRHDIYHFLNCYPEAYPENLVGDF